ncbi:MAG: competence protein CoiA family protein [Tissierellia bacterium]|nr:competence protein CoiA family protein [Tissierellia bacterium]MDD4089275.1 competence protein CoiA family protein [Tissierellia bacterium]
MNKESEEQKRGKIAIYKWLKVQYNEVYIDKKYGTRRANISLESVKGVIAIQYIRNERALHEWNKKREDFKDLGITDLYIFSYKGFSIFQESHELFRQIVQKYSVDKTIKILNTDNNEMILKRYIDFFDKEGKLFYSAVFYKSYDFSSIKLTEDGNIVSNFNQLYSEEFEKHKIIARERYKAVENEKRRRAAEINKRIKIDSYSILYSSKQTLYKTVDTNFYTINSNVKKDNNIHSISDEFLSKYSKSEGLTDDELDIEVKNYINKNSSSDSEWWFGQDKQFRLVKCKSCEKYFSSYFCVEYQYHSGTCNACDKMRDKNR